tara:strand:- start:1104 stop:1535 length:432 start_codon:yes stop_codon:yes gene_type:complete
MMLALLMFPAVLPFAPHKTVHAVYDSHVTSSHGGTSHHAQSNHSHNDHEGGEHLAHDYQEHGFSADMASYYSDILHVDLRQADAGPQVPVMDLDQDIDYDLSADIAQQTRYELASLQTRAPPIKLAHTQDHSSLYLETLRLRI